MAFSRALSVISIISVSWLAAVGCGDDDSSSQQPGAAGEGGEAGTGGTSAAGTSNGGTSSAGEAGNGTGGTAGDAGAGVGGQPVMGGAGGAGGEPPVAPGGAAGEGGAGGEGGGTVRAAQCTYECEQDDDCFIDENNPRACDLQTNRCYATDSVTCVNDTSCIPFASSWSSCASDINCADDDSERCVAVDGTGYCAPVEGPDGCDEFSEAVALPVFGTPTAMANVCAAVWDRCREGICYFGCADPLFGGFCGAGSGDTCNEVTGQCECGTGAECAGTEVCQADKTCAECLTDQDCIDLDTNGLDKCFEGKCGCGAASSCPDITEAATPVCE